MPPGGEGAPPDIAITPDGKTAYVVTGEQLVPVNVAANTAETPIEVPTPWAVAIPPDGSRAYVANIVGNALVEVNLTTRAVTGSIAVGASPDAVAITPDGSRAYVANEGENTVSVVNLATKAVVGTIPVGTRPQAIAITPDGSRAYVANRSSGNVSVVDLASATVVQTIPLGGGPNAIAITPDGSRAYVTEIEAGEMSVLDTSTNAVAGTLAIPGYQTDLAITPNGSSSYTTLEEEPAGLVPVAIPSNAVGSVFAAGENPGERLGALAIVPNQPPQAAFAATPQGSPVATASGSSATASASEAFNGAVAFDASASADPDGSVARYEWDFGDGTVLANGAAKPSHTYAKVGTYQVTLTETDNEGCSTQLVFTGQTAYCNGSGVARVTHAVTVGAASHGKCISLATKASSFVPKRRPGHVVPGVRVRVAPSVPAQVTIQATLLRQKGDVNLGKLTVEIRHWRRMRFVLPRSLRPKLPLGTAVKVKVATTVHPNVPPACTLKKKQKPAILHLHVVKVFPNRVQFKRGY